MKDVAHKHKAPKNPTSPVRVPRFNLELKDGAGENLDALAKLLKTNKADAVKFGLAMALKITQAKASGHKVFIEENGKKTHEIDIPRLRMNEVVVPLEAQELSEGISEVLPTAHDEDPS